MTRKKMFNYALLFLITCIYSFCKKPPGRGGNSSIQGKVILRKYNPSNQTFSFIYPAKDVDVYIIYGNDLSYGDRIRTSYEGFFEFKYLRKGDYTIYVYSLDTIAYKGPPANPKAENIAVIKKVTITRNKQTVDAGEFIIADN